MRGFDEFQSGVFWYAQAVVAKSVFEENESRFRNVVMGVFIVFRFHGTFMFQNFMEVVVISVLLLPFHDIRVEVAEM